MFIISKDGQLKFIDPKMRLNDKDYFEQLWKIKYNIVFKEKKQNIMDYALGIKKTVYE